MYAFPQRPVTKDLLKRLKTSKPAKFHRVNGTKTHRAAYDNIEKEASRRKAHT